MLDSLIYVGLLKNRHVYLKLPEIILYYAHAHIKNMQVKNLKKEVKSFEYTPYFLELVTNLLVANSTLLEKKYVEFINTSTYLNIKVHSLSLLGLSQKQITKLLECRAITLFASLVQINKICKTPMQVTFAKAIVKELKSNKYTIISYIRYSADHDNSNQE